MLETYLGNGFNPPGVQNIVFTIISLVMFRSVFILFERYKCIMICREVIKFFSLLGRGSLYIFMYHLMVRDIMMRCISVDVVGIWFYRLLVFTPMLIIPVLLSNAEKGIVARFDKEIRM